MRLLLNVLWAIFGGGFITADAMFRYPDFFKVGIAESGNHDNRVYEDDWGERYQGLLVHGPNGTDTYTADANQILAKNLKGKLLLAHGTMDTNVPPSNTLLVVNELIKANKDFDLILLPNRTHGFGNEPYMVRRRWDYFVKNLMDAEPPKEYQIKQPQGKLVRVATGRVFDAAVDLRKSSPTFGRWAGAELSGDNHRQLWIPAGFAHGFLVLSDSADFLYKTTDYYAPQHERSVLWNDPAIGIDWPTEREPTLSAKDKAGVLLRDAQVFP